MNSDVGRVLSRNVSFLMPSVTKYPEVSTAGYRARCEVNDDWEKSLT